MQEDALDQPVAESTAATLLENEYVGEIGVRGEVGDDASESDLTFGLEQSEGDGAGDGALDDVARNAGRPIRGGQDAMHQVDVESRSVGGDDGVGAPALEGNVVHVRDRTVRRLSLPP